MAKYAFRTSAKDLKKDVVEIEDALKDQKGTRYYCPGDGCKAILTFVDDKERPHFSALHKHPHIPDCNYAADNVKYNSNNYDEKKFNFDKVLHDLMRLNPNTENQTAGGTTKTNVASSQLIPSHSINKPSIRTLGMLYRMCKAHKVNDMYNDFEILKMLVDDRSEQYYVNGIWGLKIIEARFKRYNAPHTYKGHSYAYIYLEVPYKTKSMTVQLRFKDNDNLYYFYKNRIYKNKDHKIIVASEWNTAKSKKVTSYGYIYDRKQLMIV